MAYLQVVSRQKGDSDNTVDIFNQKHSELLDQKDAGCCVFSPDSPKLPLCSLLIGNNWLIIYTSDIIQRSRPRWHQWHSRGLHRFFSQVLGWRHWICQMTASFDDLQFVFLEEEAEESQDLQSASTCSNTMKTEDQWWSSAAGYSQVKLRSQPEVQADTQSETQPDTQPDNQRQNQRHNQTHNQTHNQPEEQATEWTFMNCISRNCSFF